MWTGRMRFARAVRLGLLGLAVAASLAGLSGCAGRAAGKIALEPQEFDFGEVPNTEPVHRVVQVRNVGEGWLEITGISTSCGCTTAETDKPRLKPGETTDLKITFDPRTHGGETGQFLRQVYVRSTDPDTPEATLTFRVTVVDGKAGAPPAVAVSEEVQALYQELLCPCCGQDIGSCTCNLAAERQGLVERLVATGHSREQVYEAVFRAYGSPIFADPQLAARVRAKVAASLPSERPQLVVIPQEQDLGAVPIGGGPIVVTFTVRNEGRSDLHITGLQTNCGCTTALLRTAQGRSPVFGTDPRAAPETWSAVLRPGEEGEVVVTFDPSFHGAEGLGSFKRSVLLFSDDPLDPQMEVSFQGEVVP